MAIFLKCNTLIQEPHMNLSYAPHSPQGVVYILCDINFNFFLHLCILTLVNDPTFNLDRNACRLLIL